MIFMNMEYPGKNYRVQVYDAWLGEEFEPMDNPKDGDKIVKRELGSDGQPVVSEELVYSGGEWVEQGGGGSSDFTTATVTVDNSASGYEAQFYGGFVDEESAASSPIAYADANDSATLSLVLYKGQALVISNNPDSSVSASGDVTSSGEGLYLVTGDCTFTLTE